MSFAAFSANNIYSAKILTIFYRKAYSGGSIALYYIKNGPLHREPFSTQ